MCRAGSRRVGGEAFAWCRGGWRRGGARVQRVGVAGLERCVDVARFSRGGLGSKSGLHAVLGRRRSSVTASLAHRDRVVAADLRVAKGGGGGHDLRAARRRWRRGLARLEGGGMGGKEGLCNIGQKRNEKKRNEKTYLYLRARDGSGGTCEV